MAKQSDTPDVLAAGGFNNFYFQCVDKILDVSATTTDGKTYSLVVGKTTVATLAPADPSRMRFVRTWDPSDEVPTADLVVSGAGSASFTQADLTAVRMATPGSSGSVTLNFGSAQSQSYGPLDIPRTKNISNTRRVDRLAICNAQTRQALAKAAPPDADFTLASKAPADFHLPDSATAASLQDGVVALNSSIDSGDFVKAHADAVMLELPLPEQDTKYVDFDAFSDGQWKLAFAVGGGTVKSKGNNFTKKFDAKRKSMIGLQGTGNYLALIDDMAESGVDPLASPPLSLDAIYMYYQNVQREHSHEKVDKLYAKLLAACQRVMSGLQVHYRNAGNTKTPTWGRQDKNVIVLYVGGKLVEVGGKATTFPSIDAARSFGPPGASPATIAAQRKATKRNPRNFPVLFNNVNAPEGFRASVSRPVYGRRYESSCEGMASFRLRTLPQYYSALGVVCGTLKSGGIGHCVAVFVGPAGFYLSSNGKEPILVKNRLDIQGAVVDEFVAIYSHGNAASTLGATDFDWGFGVAPKPAGETPAQREPIVDQIMIDGKVDEALHRDARTKPGRSRAPLDWSNFLPSWV
jgi:hypothetical protein